MERPTSPVRHIWWERVDTRHSEDYQNSEQHARWHMKNDVRGHMLWKEAREEGARTGIGRCFGTFGELIQGVLPGQEKEFLVAVVDDEARGYGVRRSEVLAHVGYSSDDAETAQLVHNYLR